MSARTPKNNPRNIEWRVIAVNETNPESHAARLQSVLTDLTEQGFNIVSTMPRGDALIVTAHRMAEPQRQEAPPPPAGGGKLSN